MKTQDILPVILSILVIILVAVLEKQSKLFAAITATMPLAAPLALWIVYSSSGGDKEAVSSFTLSMFLGFLPTLAFIVAVWLAARAGLKLLPMIGIGYGVWAIGAFILYLFRNLLGLK
ncbi:MAG: hypothetical protein Kow002_11380 [Anaerolineales bacterium]